MRYAENGQTPMQTADDFLTEAEWIAANGGIAPAAAPASFPARELATVSRTIAQPSGRMHAAALALEARQLARRCRVSHPTLALVLATVAETAEAELQRDGVGALTLLAGQPMRGRAADYAHLMAEMEGAA